jgi:hypothetical protein
MKSIGQSVLQLHYGIWNPRCPPGGHIENQIAPIIDKARPSPTHPAMCYGAECGVRRMRKPSDDIMPQSQLHYWFLRYCLHRNLFRCCNKSGTITSVMLVLNTANGVTFVLCVADKKHQVSSSS